MILQSLVSQLMRANVAPPPAPKRACRPVVPGSMRQRILGLIETDDRAFTARQATELIDADATRIASTMSELCAEGQMKKIGSILQDGKLFGLFASADYTPTDADLAQLYAPNFDVIPKMLKGHGAMPSSDIAAMTGISLSAVRKRLTQMRDEGAVEVCVIDGRKVWRISA